MLSWQFLERQLQLVSGGCVRVFNHFVQITLCIIPDVNHRVAILKLNCCFLLCMQRSQFSVRVECSEFMSKCCVFRTRFDSLLQPRRVRRHGTSTGCGCWFLRPAFSACCSFAPGSSCSAAIAWKAKDVDNAAWSRRTCRLCAHTGSTSCRTTFHTFAFQRKTLHGATDKPNTVESLMILKIVYEYIAIYSYSVANLLYIC